MPVILTLRTPDRVAIDAAPFLPERLASLSTEQISREQIPRGNRRVELGDIFSVAGDPADESVVWQGSLECVNGIGDGMTRGRIMVEGTAGHDVGAAMRGGSIEIIGSAGERVGMSMTGGVIRVRGNVEGEAGTTSSARQPMRGGLILIDGNAGPNIGLGIRRGTIAVRGNVGTGAMMNATAGTLLVGGHLASRCGMGMRRGTVLSLGEQPVDLLPTFVPGRIVRPPYLKMLLDELGRHAFSIDDRFHHMVFQQHHGDMLSLGLGEILLARPWGHAA